MTAADKFTWTTYDTLLRRDFVSFAQRCFRELSPRTQFMMNWHIEIIAAKLMAPRAGQIRRLIINMPPRYLKSLLASVAFPAWCLGHDPPAQILCISYAQELADKLSRATAGGSSPAIGTSGSFRRGCHKSGRRCPNSRQPLKAAGSRPRSAGY